MNIFLINALSQDNLNIFNNKDYSVNGKKNQSFTIEKSTQAFKQTLSNEDKEYCTKQIIDILDKELQIIKNNIQESFINNHKINIADYAILSVKANSLQNLEDEVQNLDLKKELKRIKTIILSIDDSSGVHLTLEKALKDGDFNLAYWAINKGADPKLLDTVQPNKLNPETIAWLKIAAEKPEMIPQNLDHYAIKMGWGYKTTNLKVMEAQLNKASQGLTSQVQIPPLIGISDFEIWSLLKKGIPDLEKDWDDFKNSFDVDKKNKFIRTISKDEAKKIPPSITPQGEAILKRIEGKIKDYFSKPQNAYNSLLLKDWLKDIHPNFVIVRSTGKEDSDIAANAGGNLSIPFVNPTEVDISKNIGKVVGSYFGRKSIVQRLQAGEQTVFTEKPFLPVLIQEMVCEPNLGGKGSALTDIPRSGVLFTRQPGRADEVVVINSAFGSNEGVVSSQVTVDTYNVHPEGIYSVIRNKEVRFVQDRNANGKIAVGPVSNAPDMRNMPAITDTLASELAQLAKNFGQLYGQNNIKAMDMEYTIIFKQIPDGQGGMKSVPCIYPLQIRPLLSEQKLNPTHLKLDQVKTLQPSNQAKVSALLSGDCNTREITDPDSQVLFADDLPQALTKYQHLDNPAAIKLIITRKTAPLTSHEAVTFGQTGIPIMVAEDPSAYASVKNIITQSTPMSASFADPQRGLIVYGEGKQKNDLIAEGLISYPGPREYSIDETAREFSCLKKGLKEEERGLAFATVFKESVDIYNNTFEPNFAVNEFKKMSTNELLDTIAMADNPKAKEALIYLVFNRIFSITFDANQRNIVYQIVKGNPEVADDTLKDLVRVYEEIFYLVKNQILNAVDKYPPKSMNRLYYLKPLESLLLQTPSENVNGSYSLTSCLNIKANYDALNVIHKKHNIPQGRDNTLLIVMGKSFYRTDIREKWYEFIGQLDETKRQQLITNIHSLKQLNVFEEFINVFFTRFSKNYPNNAARIFEEINKVISAAKPDLDWLQAKQTSLKTLEEQVGNWGIPSFTEKNLPRLTDKIANLGLVSPGNQSFCQRYNQATQLGKLALLSYTHRVINCYDSSIKSISGSSLFETKVKKSKAFADILKPYKGMMETVMNLVDPSAAKDMMKEDDGSVRIDFKQYQEGLTKGRIYLHQDLFEFYDKLTKYEDWKSNAPQKIIDGMPTHEYFQSRGFDQICQEINSRTEDQAKKEFEARDYFSVDSFIPGSKIDRPNKLYWPSRLEEYFTVFHQTMEVILKKEITRNGMSLDLLPQNLKDMCTNFATAIGGGLNPSMITKLDNDIVVAYDVPLRQHAAKISFRINTQKTDSPISLFVNVFGGDECDRFKRTAVLASLIANKIPQMSFNRGIPPKINYNMTNGVSFTLDIPNNYTPIQEFFDRMKVMIKDNTLVDDPARDGTNASNPARYEQNVVRGDIRPGIGGTQVKQFGEYLGMRTPNDWVNVNPQFFADSLYLNLYLLDHFTHLPNYEMVEKIIRKSLEGMQHYGLKDYTGEGISPRTDLYFSAFVSPPTSSLIQGAKAALKNLIQQLDADFLKKSAEVKPTQDEIAYNEELLANINNAFQTDAKSAKEVSELIEKQKAEVEKKLSDIDTDIKNIQAHKSSLEKLLPLLGT